MAASVVEIISTNSVVVGLIVVASVVVVAVVVVVAESANVHIKLYILHF